VHSPKLLAVAGNLARIAKYETPCVIEENDMRRLAIGLLSSAIALSASIASAQTTAPTQSYAVSAASTWYGPSAGVLLGFATNSLNLGVGARGGYTLTNNIYLGGTILYHFGTSDEATGAGTTIKNTAHLLYLGPEGGYDIPAGPVLVRPYVGIGPAIATGSSSICLQGGSCSDTSANSTNFALWVGGTVLYQIGTFSVGGDLRALFVSNANSVAVFATAAMNF
jgi:hypothetical protein